MPRIVKMWLDLGPTGYPEEQVADIACDLLIVRGDEDHLVPRSSAFQLAERVPHAKLLNVPFVGHALHEDRPELLMSSINQLLEEGC